MSDIKTWLDLVDRFKEDLIDNQEEILKSIYSEELISEYAGRWIPIYNYDLVTILASHLCLGYPEESSAFETDNIFTVIQRSIYESLYSEGIEWLDEIKTQCEEEKDAMEDE